MSFSYFLTKKISRGNLSNVTPHNVTPDTYAKRKKSTKDFFI